MKKKLLQRLDDAEKSAIKNFLIRPFGMILAAIYTPLLLDYLGTEANGVWATMLSVITWINYFDLGIGNGLRNTLTKDLARKDYERAKRTVSTAYVVLGSVSVIIMIVLICVALVVDWNEVLGTNLIIRPMVVITFAFIALNFFLSLSNSVLYAMQMSERVSIRACQTQVLNIIGLLVLKMLGDGNITCMAILFGATTTVVYLWNTFQIFKIKKYLKPSIKCFEKGKVVEITNFGLRFFVVQLSSLLVLSSHNFLVARWFGAEAVTPVNTATTVFATIYSFFGALVIPFWSRTTEAFEKGEVIWVKKTIKNVMYVATIFIAILIVVAARFDELSMIWLGRVLNYQPGVVVMICLIYCIQTVQVCVNQFYFGMGNISGYAYLSVAEAIIMIPLSHMLAITLEMGPAGIKLAAAINLAISTLVVAIIIFKKLNAVEEVQDDISI